MSASKQTEVSTFVGVACGPRPGLITGAPSISSVHAGLSGSFTLAKVFFGNLAVVASFMFFCLSQRYHVRPYSAPWPNRIAHRLPLSDVVSYAEFLCHPQSVTVFPNRSSVKKQRNRFDNHKKLDGWVWEQFFNASMFDFSDSPASVTLPSINQIFTSSFNPPSNNNNRHQSKE